MNNRAFTKNGITRRAKDILKKERRHFAKVFRDANDVCPRDLALLLIGELQLAGAIENMNRRAET